MIDINTHLFSYSMIKFLVFLENNPPIKLTLLKKKVQKL